ncbi:MAG TPA: hypothetical protein VF341_02275, partial [Anaeromyxobacteraceae bacterium]
PVVPIVVANQALNFIFWRKLTDAGLFVSPVTKPAVEKDLVRAVFMATHTDEQIDRALEIFQRCGRDVGIIPYEKPHRRVDVKMARPGATGFLSSGDGGAVGTVREKGGLDLAAVLLNPAESFPQRLSDAAELITWRAINMGPEDVRKLMQLPERLWTKRHRIQNKLLSRGMNWMSERMPNSHARDEQHRDVEGDQGARSNEER